ncbi:hypothetical protein HNV12_16930 [Methanococcoides sp. SA1]|nr:hypothetical protein [Methanococcoides sp. SA1]
MKRMNKRGQEMTLGTIIAIVLGIAVLVFLIFGFSQGWNNLWERVTAFGGGDENVGTIVQACALSCSTGDDHGFCYKSRTVNYEDKSWKKGSCESLKGEVAIDSCSKIVCDASKVPALTESTVAP